MLGRVDEMSSNPELLLRDMVPRDIRKIDNVEKIIFLDLEEGTIRKFAIKIKFDWYGEKRFVVKGFNIIDEALQVVNILYSRHSVPIIISGKTGHRNIVNRRMEISDLSVVMEKDTLYREMTKCL